MIDSEEYERLRAPCEEAMSWVKENAPPETHDAIKEFGDYLAGRVEALSKQNFKAITAGAGLQGQCDRYERAMRKIVRNNGSNAVTIIRSVIKEEEKNVQP